MSDYWSIMNEAIREQRRLEDATKSHAYIMGDLLCGKLEHCSHSTLTALKRELQGYNIQTGKWSNKT